MASAMPPASHGLWATQLARRSAPVSSSSTTWIVSECFATLPLRGRRRSVPSLGPRPHFLLGARARAQVQAHGGSTQVEGLAEAVLEETAVGGLHRAGLGAEEDEGRRAHSRLRRVEELDGAAT